MNHARRGWKEGKDEDKGQGKHGSELSFREKTKR